MGRNKMEKEFSRKLNSREIEPSAQAWDRLDAMLTVGETKKATPVRRMNWLYIAAGIIGFLFVGIMLFNQKGAGNSSESVVVTEKDTLSTVEPQPVQIRGNLLKLAEPKTGVASAAESEKSSKAPLYQKSNRARVSQKSEPAVAINDKRLVNDPYLSIDNQNNQPLATPEKTNVKVDGLLASASQEQKNESQKTIAKMKVDPNSLLSQVDGELDLSFREKAINTLGKKYKNVKVALANRNKE